MVLEIGNASHHNLFFGFSANHKALFGHYGSKTTISVPNYSTPIARIHTGILSSVDGRSFWLNGGDTADQTNVNGTHLIALDDAAIARSGLSSAHFYGGDVAEIIIYTRALKKEERQSVENYLSEKYNIAID